MTTSGRESARKRTRELGKPLEGTRSGLGLDNPTVKVVQHDLSVLTAPIIKKWKSVGIDEEEIKANLDLIVHISWFLFTEDFPENFKIFERLGDEVHYGTPEQRANAQTLISSASKQIKKLEKKLEYSSKGGYGSVYSARITLEKKKERVAVKKIIHFGSRDIERNLSELYFVACCKHKNIVEFKTCYHVTADVKKLPKPELWIVMEFLEGGTLARASTGTLISDEHKAYVAKEMLLGIEYLHGLGFVHRDLKSSNVMLSITGEVKLVDFGLATDLSSGPVTKILGSAFWIPPEMILLQPHSFPADIWSFGVCMLEFILRAPPMESPHLSMYTTATKGLSGLIPASSSEGAKNFLSKCLTMEQSERPTATELLQHPWVTRPNLADGLPKVLRQIFLSRNLENLGF